MAKTLEWYVTYKTKGGTKGYGLVYGETEEQARAVFALCFDGCVLLTIVLG